MKRAPLADLAGLLAIAVAVLIVIAGAVVALVDEESYTANAYFRDAALAGFVLAATCYGLRERYPLRRRAGTIDDPADPPRVP